jgi:hypothetical protein
MDPAFSKKQLDLMTREWYMKPDGALPAYEWNFSDVNPPVHAWATFRVFKIERKLFGREDLDFLERVFQKLLINFTWYVSALLLPVIARGTLLTDLLVACLAGGLTERTLAETTSSREVSSDSTTSDPSTDPSLFPPVASFDRPTERPGWRSSASTCSTSPSSSPSTTLPMRTSLPSKLFTPSMSLFSMSLHRC